jgi:hypothetical protein
MYYLVMKIFFSRAAFQRSNNQSPMRRGIYTLLGLVFAYGLYGITLVAIAMGYMNPRLPVGYSWYSLTFQLLPLAISFLAWLIYLWTHLKQWLVLAIVTWVVVFISIPTLNQWAHSGVSLSNRDVN